MFQLIDEKNMTDIIGKELYDRLLSLAKIECIPRDGAVYDSANMEHRDFNLISLAN